VFVKFSDTLPVSFLFFVAFRLQLFYLFHHIHIHLFQISDCFLKCSMKAQWIKVFCIPCTTGGSPCQTFNKFIDVEWILQTTHCYINNIYYFKYLPVITCLHSCSCKYKFVQERGVARL